MGTEAKTALALRTEDRPTESGRGSPTWKKPAMETPELRGGGAQPCALSGFSPLKRTDFGLRLPEVREGHVLCEDTQLDASGYSSRRKQRVTADSCWSEWTIKGSKRSFCLSLGLCISFLLRFCGLEGHKFVILQFQRSEVKNQHPGTVGCG